MKIRNCFSLLSLLVILIMSSCTKESPTSITEDIGTTATERYNDKDDDTPTTPQAFDEYSEIQNIDGVLSFESWEHFFVTQVELINRVDNYNTEFFEAHPEITDEELEAMGFDENLPLLEFEQGLGFSSGRTQYETALDEWINSEAPSDENLSNRIKYGDRNTYTLVNQDGYVYIDGEMKHYETDMKNRMLFNSNCRWINFEFPKVHYYNNGKRALVSQGYYWNIPFFVRTITSTSAYKKNNSGKWRLNRTTLATGTTGRVRANECRDSGTQFFVSKKRFNRFALSTNRFTYSPLWTSIKKRDLTAFGHDLKYSDGFHGIPHNW